MKLTETQTVTLRAVVELGGARLSELAAHLEVTPSTLKDRLEGLRKKGAAEVRGKAWHATADGVAALPISSPAVSLPDAEQGAEITPRAVHSGPLSAHPGWTELLNALPLPELRALLRVLSAVALLRQAAPHLGHMPWVGAYGPPGTGKTTVGEVALHLFGGELFKVGTMTPGEAVGRRVPVPGGGFTVDTPRTMRGPVSVLDELGEAQGGLERAFFALVELGPVVQIEGHKLNQRAAVFMTWNPEGREIPLPPGAPRRGVLLDTTRQAARLTRAFTVDGAAQRVRAVLDQHPAPWCALEAFQVQAVGAELVDEGRAVLFGCATAEGRAGLPFGALSGLAAAYVALFDLDARQAVAEVVGDVAQLAASRDGLLSRPWKKDVGELRARAALPDLEVLPEVDAGEAQRAALAEQAVTQGYRRRLQERLRVMREALQGPSDRQLTAREREARADLLGRAETYAERLPHVPDGALSGVEEALSELRQAVDALGAAVHQRQVMEAQTWEGQRQQLESHLKSAKENAAEMEKTARGWEKAARELRAVAGDEVRAMALLSRWNYVQERQSEKVRAGLDLHPNRVVQAASNAAAERFHPVAGVAVSVVGMFLESRMTTRAPVKPVQVQPVRRWVDKQGNPVDPPAFIRYTLAQIEQSARQSRARSEALAQDTQRFTAELREGKERARTLGTSRTLLALVAGRE